MVIHGPDYPGCLTIPADTTMIFLDDHYDVKQLDEAISAAGYHGPICSQFLSPPSMRSADPLISLPVMLAEMAHAVSFARHDLDTQFETTHCFNFMIYKARQFRLQALKAIEWFDLQTPCYTASLWPPGSVMDSSQLYDPDPEVTEWLQSFARPWKTQDRVVGDRVGNNYDWLGNLRGFLLQGVFGPTAVALITETLEPGLEHSMFFTEKTLYPMLAGNFPIWLGGKTQAEHWQAFGFDVFNDVIDHSYQHRPTHLQRMYYAIKDNLVMLKDLELASGMRSNLQDRLMHNRMLAMDGFADRYNDRIVQNTQSPMKNQLSELLQYHRRFRKYTPI